MRNPEEVKEKPWGVQYNNDDDEKSDDDDNIIVTIGGKNVK